MNDRDLPVNRDLRHPSADDFWTGEDDDDFGRSEEDIRSAVARRPLLSSATDLLISWLPEPEDSGDTVTSNEIWDRYFGMPRGERLSVPHTPHAQRSVRHPETIRPSVAALEPWEIEAAESSVDCLFKFLRALEKCDISAAMACVSKEYHVVDDDGEIDRPRLQLELEKLVDEWRGTDVQISTTEVPDPIFHPAGVLISGTIQIDFGVKSPQPVSQLISRIFVFSKTSRGEWRLSAIAKVPQVAK